MQPFWSHVEELRILILRCLLAILCAALLCFFFCDKIINHISTTIPNLDIQSIELQRISNHSANASTVEIPKDAEIRYVSPFTETLPNKRYLLHSNSYIEIAKPRSSLSLLSPTEGFTTSLKLAFWLGILSSAPIWIFLITRFIEPALLPFEKRRILPILLLSVSLISMGLATAIFFTLPLANGYFVSFNQAIGVNSWSLAYYVDYVLTIVLGHGIAFAAISILFLAILYRWIDVETLAYYRRHAVVGILIASAILTPPDVLSQILLAIPLFLLFEGAILWGRLRKKSASKEEAH